MFLLGDMKSLPAECEKQLWQELEAVSKEPLQFISLAALLLKSCDSGTPNHTKVWSKVTTYDSVLKVGSFLEYCFFRYDHAIFF